jgi:uncharacterized cupredoxin-like copper-binding protein
MKVQFAITALAAVLASGTAWGHGEDHGRKAADTPRQVSAEETAFGKPGEAKQASRTVTIDMSDRMRFDPAQLTVKQGDTVRFRVKNSGQQLHEMVIGTMKQLQAHAEMMRKHPGMEHDEPYMAHVSPGKTGEIVWQFTQAGEFHYGCLVPGHFEAGMIGKVNVTR